MTKNTLTKIIEEHQSKLTDPPRNYIGASSIGSECLRKIWYEFKGEKGEIPPKTRRTFEIGELLECIVLDWLENSGIKISRKLLNFESKDSLLKGHADAILIEKGIPVRIIEIKTAKDASFRIFKGKGLKLWNPQYYAQVQSYMGMSGVHKGYIIVLNKDNSDLADELVEFDEEYYQELEQKALMISQAQIPPPRISGSPLWYKCKLCKFNKVCHV